MPAQRFEGKVVLVTGGTSGLGRDAVLAFAHEGARVVFTGRRREPGEATLAEVRAAGGDAQFIVADVSHEDDTAMMVRACGEAYGGLDCAFNNAGTDGVPLVPTADYEKAVWDEVIGINLTGVFLSMKHEIPALLARGGGVIVNMSAVAGFRGSKRVGAAYIASKHGVHGLTKTAALEYADRGIRVHAVCPAMIRTPMSAAGLLKDAAAEHRALAMHPLGRIGEPRDVTALVLWLCSDQATFMTGTTIPVDGGFLL
ncbi:MAG: glucose 1-dehydrogenase [Gammaproteobacteria bacterium]|nr:glucose 1-dehydrogenase [Gammaproteobacteria bacterium]